MNIRRPFAGSASPVGPRTAAFLLLGALLVVLAPSARGQLSSDLQFENFVAISCPDTVASCTDAEMQHALDGLYLAGQWVELPLTVESAGCVLDSLRSERYAGHQSILSLTFIPQSVSTGGVTVPTIIDTLTTPEGTGIG